MIQARVNPDSSEKCRSRAFIPNALSSDGLRCLLNKVQSTEDIITLVHRAHPNQGKVFLLEGNRVIEESKILNPTGIRYLLQGDLKPAIQMLEAHGASKTSSIFLKSLLAVLHHQRSQDVKALDRAQKSYQTSVLQEQALRGKLKALSKEINGIGEICDDIIMHDDFSWMKGHVMSRCIRNIVARLRVSINEVKVKRESLRKLQRSSDESSGLLERFKRASETPQVSFGTSDCSYMKENK